MNSKSACIYCGYDHVPTDSEIITGEFTCDRCGQFVVFKRLETDPDQCAVDITDPLDRFISEVSGKPISNEPIGRPNVSNTTPLYSKRAGAADGAVSGVAAGIAFIGCGGLLTLTGVLAIIGVPLIIIGFIALVIGPIIGAISGAEDAAYSIIGDCPYCGTLVAGDKRKPSVKCRGCKRWIVIRNGSYLKT